MLSLIISLHFIDSRLSSPSIDKPRLFGEIYQLRCQNSHFEPDTGQDANRKQEIK